MLNRKLVTIALLSILFLASLKSLSMELSKSYLYRDHQGIFSIKKEEQVVQAVNYRQELIEGDNQLLVKLIDKYLYKLTRHKKFIRDDELGKVDEHTQTQTQISLNNLNTIRQAINLIRPDFNNKSDNELRQFFKAEVARIGRYYGDELSDDSDSEDELAYNNEQNKKASRLKAQSDYQTTSFWLRTVRATKGSSPAKSVGNKKGVNAGLQGRLNNLRLRHEEREISDDYVIGILQGLKKAKGKKGCKPLKELTVIKDRQQRASLAQEITKEAQEDLKRINQILRERRQITQNELNNIKTKFLVAQYRGINYMLDRWSADARRYHRQMQEENCYQYCEMVLKTLHYCIYTELNAKNDFTLRPDLRDHLLAEATRLKKLFRQLENSGPCVDYSFTQPYLFNSISDCLQNRFSNGIDDHLRKIQELRIRYPDYWAKMLPSAHNPAIATGDRPYHTLKYTYGLKNYYEHPFYPRYNNDGLIEYSHAGKVYISLHTLDEILLHDKPNKISQLDKQARVVIKDDIAPEKETTFLSFIPAQNIVYQHVAKYPSFKGTYQEKRSINTIKYGLNEVLYNSFKYFIINSKPESTLRDLIIELLSEWLASYHEVLLIEIAKEEARQSGGILVYINRDGLLSFEADTGRIFTRSDIHVDLRNMVHVLRNIRQNFGIPEKSSTEIPGFQLVNRKIWDSIKDMLSKLTETSLSDFADKLGLSEQQEALVISKDRTRQQILLEVIKSVTNQYLDASIACSEQQRILPQLMNQDHFYQETEINALLHNYLRSDNDDFQARILSAAHPFIQGQLSNSAQNDFRNRLQEAFTSGVPSVIPVNLTDEVIDQYDITMPGNHWVGLVIHHIQDSHYQVEYIDSLMSPAADFTIKQLTDLQDKQQWAVAKMVYDAAGLADVNIDFTVLHTDQQSGDVDCGAWLVDNLVERVNNRPLRINTQISGSILRRQHAYFGSCSSGQPAVLTLQSFNL